MLASDAGPPTDPRAHYFVSRPEDSPKGFRFWDVFSDSKNERQHIESLPVPTSPMLTTTRSPVAQEFPQVSAPIAEVAAPVVEVTKVEYVEEVIDLPTEVHRIDIKTVEVPYVQERVTYVPKVEFYEETVELTDPPDVMPMTTAPSYPATYMTAPPQTAMSAAYATPALPSRASPPISVHPSSSPTRYLPPQMAPGPPGRPLYLPPQMAPVGPTPHGVLLTRPDMHSAIRPTPQKLLLAPPPGSSYRFTQPHIHPAPRPVPLRAPPVVQYAMTRPAFLPVTNAGNIFSARPPALPTISYPSLFAAENSSGVAPVAVPPTPALPAHVFYAGPPALPLPPAPATFTHDVGAGPLLATPFAQSPPMDWPSHNTLLPTGAFGDAPRAPSPPYVAEPFVVPFIAETTERPVLRGTVINPFTPSSPPLPPPFGPMPPLPLAAMTRCAPAPAPQTVMSPSFRSGQPMPHMPLMQLPPPPVHAYASPVPTPIIGSPNTLVGSPFQSTGYPLRDFVTPRAADPTYAHMRSLEEEYARNWSVRGRSSPVVSPIAVAPVERTLWSGVADSPSYVGMVSPLQRTWVAPHEFDDRPTIPPQLG
eukprot:GEMP01011957.1.p1 GENE.GEMP01011957.1~~GEMP01011957.1.p1  ORF type:complete len:590 (+),score=135.15 GEMP01011957.1:605-2374(+)